jgi:hypothetical protein
MKNVNKSTFISTRNELLKKIKKLEIDKIYPTSMMGSSNDKTRVYLSRLADSGCIIKTRRGYFYKPSNKTIYKRSDKIIPLNKSIFSNDLFWSVNDGFKIEADTLIDAYLKNWSEKDLMALYSLFGYSRLIERALKIYKKRSDENYKSIRSLLERFDRWRADDKRS